MSAMSSGDFDRFSDYYLVEHQWTNLVGCCWCGTDLLMSPSGQLIEVGRVMQAQITCFVCKCINIFNWDEITA